MKVKAVIMRPDRTNDVVVPKKKSIEGKTFRHDGVTYFLHADRFQVTWQRGKMWQKKYFSTYYYVQGISQPLPVPDFQMVEEPQTNGKIDPTTKLPAVEFGPDGKPIMIQKFPKVIDAGIKGEELAAIFNPWFYRIIASQTKSAWEQVQMYLTIGIALALLYVIFKLHTLNVDSIEGLHELLAPPPAPVAIAPPPPTTLVGNG